LKTEHAYPGRDSLVQQRGELGDVLTRSRIITEEQLEQVRSLLSDQSDLGNLLLMMGMVSEEDLCRAHSLYAGVISGRVDPEKLKPQVVRSLPRHLTKRFGVLPVSVNDGRMLVASANVPTPNLFVELKQFTTLEVDFQLVTRSNFEEIEKLASASAATGAG
jgi:type IV pilus assembly protein PilB